MPACLVGDLGSIPSPGVFQFAYSIYQDRRAFGFHFVKVLCLLRLLNKMKSHNDSPQSKNSLFGSSVRKTLPNKELVKKLVEDRLNLGTTPSFVNGTVAKILSGVIGGSGSQSAESSSKIIVRNRKRVESEATNRRASSLKAFTRLPLANSFEQRFQDIKEELRFQSRDEHEQAQRIMLEEHCRLVRQYEIAQSKANKKVLGRVRAYAANTHQGLVRAYNEDRVSIVAHFGPARKSSLFAVFDGHGGSACVDFLRDNLHRLLAQELSGHSNPRDCLRNAILKAEASVLASSHITKDFSGSCLLVALVTGDIVHVANVGDCRLLASEDHGSVVVQVTNDHKPSDPIEQSRIIKAGGTVYQNKGAGEEDYPYRVMPGRLSVSRTIGDLEAKHDKYGGNPNVVIAEPEIHEYVISDASDFLLLGCDGIYDRLTNDEICQRIYQCRDYAPGDLQDTVGRCAEAVLVEAFKKQAGDNLSVLIVAFDGFAKNKRTAKEQRGAPSPKPPDKPGTSRLQRSTSNLASFKRLQTVKEVLRRNTPSRR